MPLHSGTLLVAAVGKLKTPSWSSAQTLYLGRVKRYITATLVEVKDAVGQGLLEEAAIEKEGQLLLSATKGARHIIALTPTGDSYDSSQLAEFLKKRVETYGRIAFVIGGPAGLSKELLEACGSRLSLSRLTFPHELARIVLLEQLYRSFTILSGEKYHR